MLSPTQADDNMRFIFQVSGYTNALRSLLIRTIQKNVANPDSEPAASFRRGFQLSIFNIFKTRAVEQDQLLPEKNRLVKDLDDVYPLFQFPFAVFDLADQIALFKELDAFEAGFDGLIKDGRYLEATFSTYWAELMVHFFPRKRPISFSQQFSLSLLHDRYPGYLSDFFVTLRQSFKDKKLPILLVELSREFLYNEAIAHKDEEKLAEAMGAAFLNLLNFSAHLGEEFVATLQIFGLLLGGTDFEICVLYPDFGSGKARGPGEELRPFTMIFRTSRRHWRFRMVGNDYNYMEHGIDNNFCCGGKEKSVKSAKSPYDFGQAPREPHLPSPAAISQLRKVEEFNNSIPFDTQKAYFLESFKTEPLNQTGMLAFCRFVDLVTAESQRILTKLGQDSEEPDDQHFYPDERIRLMSQGRTPTPSGKTAASPKAAYHHALSKKQPSSPTKPRRTNTNAPLEASPVLQVISVEDPDEKTAEFSIECVIIEKRASAYEIQIYSHDAVCASSLFPALVEYDTDDEHQMTSLTIERVEPISTFIRKNHYLFCRAGLQMVVSRLLMDILGALRILHSIGFVHGDLSPSNIGYNCRTGTWQLYDFDRSRPIDIAGSQVYESGTFGYRSDFYEKSGLYAPMDDYISLTMVCQSVFADLNVEPEAEYPEWSQLVGDKSDRSKFDADSYYHHAFDCFCKIFHEYTDENIDDDESFKEARRMIDRMQINLC